MAGMGSCIPMLVKLASATRLLVNILSQDALMSESSVMPLSPPTSMPTNATRQGIDTSLTDVVLRFTDWASINCAMVFWHVVRCVHKQQHNIAFVCIVSGQGLVAMCVLVCAARAVSASVAVHSVGVRVRVRCPYNQCWCDYDVPNVCVKCVGACWW